MIAMSFRRLIRDPALIEALDWRSREMTRLYSLPDRFLGRALRDIGRAARAELGAPYDYPDFTGYGASTLWHVIPALARALGERDLSQDERFGALLLPESKADMRRFTGLCLGNSEIPMLALKKGAYSQLPNCYLISGEFVNGSPITIALDRVAPPAPDSTDWVAQHMREISMCRFGHSDFSSWSPQFNDFPRRSSNIFRDDFDIDEKEGVLEFGMEP